MSEPDDRFNGLHRRLDEITTLLQNSLQTQARHDERIKELQRDVSGMAAKLWGAIAGVGAIAVTWVADMLKGGSHH